MIYTGLTSITFRKKTVSQVAEQVRKAKLDAIEWGGDIHCPHGDINKAKTAAKITAENGLAVSSYGSYYRCDGDFMPVLDSALALNAPTIRVWAGSKGTDVTDIDYFKKVSDNLRHISEISAKHNIKIACEFHNNSLTDTEIGTVGLMNSAKNVLTYWQPPVGMNDKLRKSGLEKIKPWLSNIHVFYWVNGQRKLLTEGEQSWIDYFEVIKSIEGNRYALIEFVKNDEQECFLKDAKTLRKILSIIN